MSNQTTETNLIIIPSKNLIKFHKIYGKYYNEQMFIKINNIEYCEISTTNKYFKNSIFIIINEDVIFFDLISLIDFFDSNWNIGSKTIFQSIYVFDMKLFEPLTLITKLNKSNCFTWTFNNLGYYVYF